MFSSLSALTSQTRAKSLTFRIGEPLKDEDVSSQLELRDSLLDAYAKYVEFVPVPVVHMVVSPGRYFDRKVVEGIAGVISKGGDIALESEGKYLFSGLRMDKLYSKGPAQEAVAFLQNLSVNLPRLAYESNKDETYFRAKLSLLLQTAINALVNRKDYVRDGLKKGLLPAISQIPTVSSLEEMPLVVNLIGLNSAISNLLSERETLSKRELGFKIIDTASKVAFEKSEKLGHKGLISMIHLEGTERLSEIDVEKYGRSQEARHGGYQEGIIAQSDVIDNQSAISEIAEISRAASGGSLVRISFPKELGENQNFGNIVSGVSGKIPFVRFSRNPETCKKCGMKVFGGGRCSYCKSTSLVSHSNLI
jgi:ribonucleoside-triphosphate reductase (formate)